MINLKPLAALLRVPEDKIAHIGLGVMWLAIAVMVSWLQRDYGIGPAVAASSTAYAAMYEFSQWYRKDGKPEVLDAVATALPGFVFWAILEFVK